MIQNFLLYLAVKLPNVSNVSDLNLEKMEGFKRFRKTVNPQKLELPKGLEWQIPRNALQVGSRTINYELKTLKSIFRFGKKQGMCHHNPCEDITYLKVTNSTEPRFLTEEECQVLLNSATDKYRPVLYTFLNTGLRLGELINLQWTDILWERKLLAIREKVDWRPKAGARDVPLHDGLIEFCQESGQLMP